MENQHRKIAGYKELNQDQIDKMNEIKQLAAQVGDLVYELDEMFPNPGQQSRWVSIGRTDLQQGFMALSRAVADPDFF